jgi:hypothetical protein
MTVRALAAGLLLATLVGCADDRVGPTSTPASTPASTPEPPPASTPAQPGDPGEASLAVLDNRSPLPGLVFGSMNLPNSALNSVHTGWMQGGPLDPSNILSYLSGARARGGRVVIKLCKGRDDYVKNPDGTFSLSKWEALVARYRNVNLGPYIDDGTILGHYLIDEPHRASRWGGKIIPPSTLEAMAKYSKQLWPGMTTMVRVAPSWLAGFSTTYAYVDAGWAQYASGKGDAGSWIAAEVAAAKRKGLGLVVGLNVLDGGNGSSRIAGRTRGDYAMSASEIGSYGSALLGQSYGCGFFNWTYDSGYYGRTDIKSAMAAVSTTARSHAKTSCRQ